MSSTLTPSKRPSKPRGSGSKPNALLAKYLWNGAPQISSGQLFPLNQFGDYVLSRERIIKAFDVEIASQTEEHPGESASVYFHGCRGSGKTCLLHLLAKHLKSEGYEVYYFESASCLSEGNLYNALKTYLDMNKDKKVAVVVDEVGANPSAAAFVTLLKGPYPNLITVGAAVPRYLKTGCAATFRKLFNMNDIALRADDVDFQALVKHCAKNLNRTTAEMTACICEEIRAQCGGHAYPTLSFIEHFFSRGDVPESVLDSVGTFRKYFCSTAFANSRVYLGIDSRCSASHQDPQVDDAVIRVMSGLDMPSDISTLEDVGFWSDQNCNFTSLFLMQQYISRKFRPKIAETPIYLKKQAPAKNIQLLIEQGLAEMSNEDFTCINHEGNFCVENALSFNWGSKVLKKIPNVFLRFQIRPVSGRGLLDFYVNSFVDCVIEVLVDGSKMDERLSGFTGKMFYKNGLVENVKIRYQDVERFVLLNFVMTKKEIQLPFDKAHHDKVYTFIRATNTLYRGNKMIKRPAIPKLSGSSTPRTARIFRKKGVLSPTNSKAQLKSKLKPKPKSTSKKST